MSETHRDWVPVDISVHNQRAHAFAQTHALVSLQTDSLVVTSSRGFGRELPPTASVHPSFKNRRHTVDASLFQGALQRKRDYVRYAWEMVPQDFTYPIEPQSRSEQVGTSMRETDEPVQRRTVLPFPDPLRYRNLHRWGYVWPPFNEDTYAHIGNAMVSNEDICSIMQLTGFHCWYRDTVLDAALELTSLYYDAEDNGIAVASSTTAQCVQFAATGVDDADMNELRAYKTMFEGKKWIFVPLNDGMGGTSAEEVRGTHWALLAIDRPNKRAHYIDGLFSWTDDWQNIGRSLALAFGNLLGDGMYEFCIEHNAPHQWNHNQFRGTDSGPCGPYVVKMVQEIMCYIRYHQRHETEDQISLRLGSGFSSSFNFNSFGERRCLLWTLAGFKASQVANDRAMQHDNMTLGQPRPFGLVELRDPASLLYDAPLFDENTLTSQQLKSHHDIAVRQLQQQQQQQHQFQHQYEHQYEHQYQYQRNMSTSSQNSSGSSGGISISSEAGAPYIQGGYDGAQDDHIANEVEMHDRPASTVRDYDGDVSIEEVPNDEFSPYCFVRDITQRPSTPDQPSSPISDTSTMQSIPDLESLTDNSQDHVEAIRSDQNPQEYDDRNANDDVPM
ncbi:hypothetical protein SLS60_006922 [Paraconiothyrium brasiliense]|uniref:Ubiquitin-like protease family profile domain-containing protein n=1 Tax=Paraconiothyrium brasiliense TaxID=300254 RepID=A0ABR3R7X9_9PLEO